jgi:hypothetical protein
MPIGYRNFFSFLIRVEFCVARSRDAEAPRPSLCAPGCFVSETSTVQENAFIDSCPGLVKLFGMRSPFFVLQRRSGARVPRVGGGILASANFVEAQKLRPLSEFIERLFRCDAEIDARSAAGVSDRGYTRSLAFVQAARGRLITSHFGGRRSLPRPRA